MKNKSLYLPPKNSYKLIKSLNSIEPRSLSVQLPIIWNKAISSDMYDIKNKKIIDFTSTIFVANIGHSNQRLKKYLIRGINNNLIHCYIYPHKIREIYIKELLKFSKNIFDKVLLLSSGTETTEAALKLMRMNGIKNKKRKLGIITFEGNWHGRTLGAQLMSGGKQKERWIGFKDKNIYKLPFPYPWIIKNTSIENFFYKSIRHIKKKINPKKDICGTMIETFQGWGALFYPKKYMQLFYKFCKKNKIIITFDEMQSGFARTGKAFGFMHYGIKPDLICCGKGMGGGFPLSGVLGKKYLMDIPKPGEMSSTHSGNPLSCYAGLAVLDEINSKKLITKTKKNEKILFYYLNKIKNNNNKFIEQISGKGLIAAIIFKIDKDKKVFKKIKSVCEISLQSGLLVVYTGRESIKIGPPLNISKKDLIKGLSILNNSIKMCFK